VKPSTNVRAAIVLFFFVPHSALFARQNTLPASVLAGLKSPDVQRRSDAYMKIKADEAALQLPEVRKELVELLDRENRYLHSAKRDLGEGFAEYISELLDTVTQFVDWNDSRQLCIVAQSPYDPESQIAADLAVKGGEVVAPCLLNMSQGNLYGRTDSGRALMGDRYQSIPVLLHLAAVTNGLQPSLRQQIAQLAIAGLRDSDVTVREGTIEAVGRFGTQEMIPILQDIARSDPVSRRLDNGQLRFSVRDAAMKAIQSIQERANAK
jgi:hypothetical protein